MLHQLYAVIWSRNGVGLSCMGAYRHADAIDSVRLTVHAIQVCRYSVHVGRSMLASTKMAIFRGVKSRNWQSRSAGATETLRMN